MKHVVVYFKMMFLRLQKLYWTLKYETLPQVRTRVRYYWWIVRYGGKNNIPREVVMGAMADSLKRMNDNLEKALQASVESRDTNHEETQEILKTLEAAQEFTSGIKELDTDKKKGHE